MYYYTLLTILLGWLQLKLRNQQMLVISRQAPNVTVDPQLANILPAMYLPQLSSSGMGGYSDLRHRKMLISVRFIPNYRLG